MIKENIGMAIGSNCHGYSLTIMDLLAKSQVVRIA